MGHIHGLKTRSQSCETSLMTGSSPWPWEGWGRKFGHSAWSNQHPHPPPGVWQQEAQV